MRSARRLIRRKAPVHESIFPRCGPRPVEPGERGRNAVCRDCPRDGNQGWYCLGDRSAGIRRISNGHACVVAFLNTLLQERDTSHHPISKSLTNGFIATALVLAARSGHSVRALEDSPHAGEWYELMDLHAQSMVQSRPRPLARSAYQAARVGAMHAASNLTENARNKSRACTLRGRPLFSGARAGTSLGRMPRKHWQYAQHLTDVPIPAIIPAELIGVQYCPALGGALHEAYAAECRSHR
jgi:Family of unknown function (DUF6086)